MKAQELLLRYAAGERDFRYANLRGQRLEGQDLSGSNFSYADIRGANFSRTILRDTHLIGVKAGLQSSWFVFTNILVVLVTLAILSNSALVVTASSLIVIGSSTFAASNSDSNPLTLAMTAILSVGGVGGTSLFLSLVICIFTIGSILPSIIIMGFIPIGLFFIGCVVLASVGSRSGTVSTAVDSGVSRVYGVFGVFIAVLLGTVDELIKFPIISTGGTSFLSADLTGANFTQADLGNTNFREAILDSVCWLQVRGLERSLIRLKSLNNPHRLCCMIRKTIRFALRSSWY